MKFMKKLFLVIFLALVVNANATEQMLDELNVGNAKFQIKQEPLKFHSKYEHIVEFMDSEICSANWRRYLAKWRVHEGVFYLVDLVKNPCSKYETPNKKILNFFSGKNEIGIIANWYSGKVHFQIGEDTIILDEKGDMIGFEYEAVVYDISKGYIISREIKVVRDKF